MTDEPVLAEQFSQKRMDKCTEVFQKVVNNWITTRSFDCRIVVDELPEGKSLEELGKMYFSVGVKDDLTALPLVDFLIVVKMVSQHAQKAKNRQGNKESYQVTTRYTESEVFALLADVQKKLGFEVREKTR